MYLVGIPYPGEGKIYEVCYQTEECQWTSTLVEMLIEGMFMQTTLKLVQAFTQLL